MVGPAGPFLRLEADMDNLRPGRDKGSSMGNCVAIENIEDMRCREGIDDVELREEIRRLHIGDFVRLTLLTGTTTSAGAPVLVRITRIRGHAFRGKLANRPASTG